MKKILLPFALLAAVCLFLLPGTGLADAEAVTEDGFFYALSGSRAVITGYDPGYEILPGVVIVPETCGGRLVTAIGERAFEDREEITSVYLPGTIHTIEASAFDGCSALRFINLPEGLTRIGRSAFAHCALDHPVLPESLTEIEADAFEEGAVWDTLILPDLVDTIGEGAFRGCGINRLKLSKNLKTVPSHAFADCGIELVDMLDCPNLRTIESYAFADNEGIDYISLPRKLTSVQDDAFDGCRLRDFHIPESVREIGMFFDPADVASTFTVHCRKRSPGASFASTCGADFDYQYTKAQKDRVRPHSLDYLTAEEYIKDNERYADAMPYLRRAADAGEAIAQYMLAECYIEGYSVEKDYTTGIRWARLAADQDYVSAQAILGNCYRHGHGVRRDYTLAVYWYMLAADQGSRSGLVNLGYCYEKGLGVEIDYEIAEAYYRMAKAVGQKSAEKRLSDLRAKMG